MFLQSRGIVPQHFYDQRSNPLAKKLAQQSYANPKVDIMRLSHNVRKNMKREDEDENQYATGAPNRENMASAN